MNNKLMKELENQLNIAFQVRSTRGFKEICINVYYLYNFMFDNNYISKEQYQYLVHSLDEIKEII